MKSRRATWCPANFKEAKEIVGWLLFLFCYILDLADCYEVGLKT